ncbi:hypothetical protein SE17_39185 [Kouleothrix aurantiaca]|uniref:Uncharacterized protein n=1 Tax=Kouleothrix aurantiaca TaxID=186479 RepID=A0A0P9H2G2_9CHLR|nr:hypothetical protein SE17_39185 [Kouleothrix aurantiaca]
MGEIRCWFWPKTRMKDEANLVIRPSSFVWETRSELQRAVLATSARPARAGCLHPPAGATPPRAVAHPHSAPGCTQTAGRALRRTQSRAARRWW